MIGLRELVDAAKANNEEVLAFAEIHDNQAVREWWETSGFDLDDLFTYCEMVAKRGAEYILAGESPVTVMTGMTLAGIATGYIVRRDLDLNDEWEEAA